MCFSIEYTFLGLRGRGGAYHVHEFPVAASRLGSGSERCSIAAVGDNFNPYNVDRNKSPLPGFGTHYLSEHSCC